VLKLDSLLSAPSSGLSCTQFCSEITLHAADHHCLDTVLSLLHMGSKLLEHAQEV
jgi:hypothetical protein